MSGATTTSGSPGWRPYVFLAKNEVELDPDDDDAYDLLVAVATGEIDDVGQIAAALSSWREPGD